MTPTPVLPSLPEIERLVNSFQNYCFGFAQEPSNEHTGRRMLDARKSLMAAIESLSRAPAEPVNSAGETPEQHAHRWATELAVSMARKFYPEAPQFEPMSDLLGVITQIDNMTTGLVRAPAEPAETEAWLIRMSDGTRFIHSHNAIADYRSLDPAAKVVELVPRGSGAHPTESAGPAAAQPIAEGLLQSACARMLANANWSVAGALSPASKRKDFPSNGWASVKLRDLASVRDTLSAASGDSTESAGPAPADYSEQLTKAKNLLVRLWDCHPSTRPMIEGATGSWFVWSANRDAALGESHDASA